MKRLLERLLIFLCITTIVILLPTNVVKAEKANVSPKSPIKISNVKMNRTSAQPGQKIKYSLTLKNDSIQKFMKKYVNIYGVDGDSVDEIYFVWYGPNKQSIWKEYKWKGTSKKKKTLKISDEILIREGMEAGEWHLGFIRLFVSGKEEYFDIYDSRNDEWKDDHTPLMDFSDFDFTICNTGKSDYAPPKLNLNSIKVSKNYINSNQKSTFSIKVKDVSPIKYVDCMWLLYKKGNYGKNCDKTLDYTMKYNKKKKRYECNVKFDTTVYRKAELHEIWVEDIYGNWKRYEANYNSHNKWNKYYNAYRKVTIMKK